MAGPGGASGFILGNGVPEAAGQACCRRRDRSEAAVDGGGRHGVRAGKTFHYPQRRHEMSQWKHRKKGEKAMPSAKRQAACGEAPSTRRHRFPTSPSFHLPGAAATKHHELDGLATFSSIQEAAGLRSRCQQGPVPSEGSFLLLPAPGGGSKLGHPLACRRITPISASVITWPAPYLSMSPGLNVPLLIEMLVLLDLGLTHSDVASP